MRPKVVSRGWQGHVAMAEPTGSLAQAHYCPFLGIAFQKAPAGGKDQACIVAKAVLAGCSWQYQPTAVFGGQSPVDHFGWTDDPVGKAKEHFASKCGPAEARSHGNGTGGDFTCVDLGKAFIDGEWVPLGTTCY